MSRYSPRVRLTNSSTASTVANWFGNQFVIVGSYESIATVTIGASNQPTIVFSDIPSIYQHLQIRGIARVTGGASIAIQFNSDTGTNTNYTRHYINGSGTAAAAGGAADSSRVFAGSASQASNTFGANVIDILDYKDTNKYTTVRSISGFDDNGSGYFQFMSGVWKNTAAVTSITIKQYDNYNFTQYSTFALYGIRGV